MIKLVKLLDNIKDYLLNKSDRYNFYKNSYTDLKNKKENDNNNDIINYVGLKDGKYYSSSGIPHDKQPHFFNVYNKHFSKFIGKNVTILEIGVRDGASLELWRDFFGSNCKVYGIDINPKCKELETEQTEIFIGNSEDRNFLRSIKEKVPQIDIFIDDGGHKMNQQIIAFEEFYPHLSPN